MAEKLGSSSVVRVIDMSTMVGISREIREYNRLENTYLKTISNCLDLIYSKLNKAAFVTENGSTGAIIPTNTGNRSSGKQSTINATTIGSEIGGITGKAIGTALTTAGKTAGAAAGTAAGAAIGSAIAPGLGTLIGTLAGMLIDAGVSEWNAAKEDKEAAFKERAGERYTKVQKEKTASIQNGSAIAMEKQYKAADENDKSNTLQAKIEELNELQSGLDEIAGAEYNKELEKSIDAKINFIKENKPKLEKIYAMMGKNAGNDESAKIMSEIDSMQSLLNEDFFNNNLNAGNSYVVEEWFLASKANGENIYENTDAGKNTANMNWETFRHISADMAYPFDKYYEYAKQFNDFGQKDAGGHLAHLANLRLNDMADQEAANAIREEAKSRWNEYLSMGGGAHTGNNLDFNDGYYRTQILNGESYNYPGVTNFSYQPTDYLKTSLSKEQGTTLTPSVVYVALSPEQIATIGGAAPAYTTTTQENQEEEKQPTAVTNNYNASVNVTKMEVMDKAMVQSLVDEMLNKLILTYENSPQH